MREKSDIQKQLAALQKKESKAQWHQKRKHRENSPGSASDQGPVSRKSLKFSGPFRVT